MVLMKLILALLFEDKLMSQYLYNEDIVFTFHHSSSIEFEDAENAEKIEIIPSLVVTHIIVVVSVEKHWRAFDKSGRGSAG
jgi:hypothetical protein